MRTTDGHASSPAPARSLGSLARRHGRRVAVKLGPALGLAGVAFAAAHMQDVFDIAAPITLVALMLVGFTRCSIPARIAIEILLFLLLSGYLFSVSLANDALANLSPIEFIARFGKIIYIAGVFVAFYLFKPHCAVERVMYRAAILVALVLSVASLYSYFVAPIQSGDIRLSNDNAIQGLFGGKNPMAGCTGAILVLLLLSFVARATPYAPLRSEVVIGIASVLVGATFLFAKSRGYALGIMAAFGWLAVRTALLDWTNFRVSRQTLAYVTACLGFLAAVLVFGGDRYEEAFDNDANVSTRFELWERAARMFLTSPIIGLGLGSFQAVSSSFETVMSGVLAFKISGFYLPGHIEHDVEGGMHVHNVYLQILVDGGLIGFMLFFAIIVLIVRRAVAVGRMAPVVDEGLQSLARLNAALVITMVFYLAVAGVTAGFTFTSPTMSWLFFVASARLVRQHQALAAMARSARVAGRMALPPGERGLGWRERA